MKTLFQTVPEQDPDGNDKGTRYMQPDLSQHKLSESLFQQFLETAPDATLIINEESRIIMVNAQVERIFGYSRDELLYEHIHVLLPVRYHDRHQNHIKNYFTMPQVRPMGTHLDLYGQRRDGTEFPVEISLSPINEENRVLVYAAIRDVSERIRIQEALQESEETYRMLFENANDAIFIMDLDGVHLQVNQKAIDLLGYDKEELVGLGYKDIVVQGEVQQAENRLDMLLKGQDLPLYERFFKTKQGITIPVEINVSLIRDTGGRARFIQSIIRDIRGRKEAELALRESEAKFRNIFESSPFGMHMYQLEPEGELRLIDANPAADSILGIDHKTRLGNPLEVAFSMTGATELPEQFRKVVEGGETLNIEKFVYKDEDIKGIFEIRVFRTMPGRIVAAFSDVTERIANQEAQAQLLEEISQQHEQLHALNVQLSEIQEAERKEIARELHDQVGQNLTALDFHLNLIRSLLSEDYSVSDRISSELDTSATLLTQMAESIREVMTNLRPPMFDNYGLMAALDWYGSEFIAPRGIAFSIDGQEPNPRLALEVELSLYRIAQEATTNIIKHAKASEVTMGVQMNAESDSIELVISDNGVGFSPSQRTELKGRYHWGLVTMAERVRGFGGHFQIDSKPGEGTKIIVEVPR
jgi:PAS domain S-box-containing protein